MINNQPMLYVYTATPFALSSVANNQINNQIGFTFLFIGCLLTIIFAFISVIMLINKRLKNEVKEKTSQLEEHVIKLENSNKELKITKQSLEDINKNILYANQKLVENDEKQKIFINTAAHELRTPTQAISGYCEMNDELFQELVDKNCKLKKDRNFEKTLPLIAEYHSLIGKNSDRLNNLINDLLDVARFDSNIKFELHKERFDLVKEIDSLVNVQLHKKIKDKNLNVDFIPDVGMSECWIHADKLRISQVLINLLSNAIKFSHIADTITISINTISKGSDFNKTNQISINISDTGRGISSIIIPHLFGRFVTDSVSGTGLGLFISKNIVEAHGGRIWAFNNDDGKGATFCFGLPLYEN